MLLDKINNTGDIRNIPEEELDALAEEIRSFLITHLSKTGGHLASNLGVVELTIALHRVLDFPADKLLWDVGHQCYTHKILTGRKDGFDRLRQKGGISGFPKKSESETDVFETGHASNAASAALGMVNARLLSGGSETIVVVLGDGALSGGEAYEALNNAAKLNTNFIIILNDNNMSISKPVGGVSRYLDGIRTAQRYLDLKADIYESLNRGDRRKKVITGIRRAKNSFKQLFVPGMFFENIGITYLGPVDGHDIGALTRMISEAKKVPKAVVLHVQTGKGKGYPPAEHHPARFHGPDPYHIENGVPLRRKKPAYQDIFSTVMCKLGERDEKICAITAAMAEGTGLKRFRNRFPDRFFDVGIAEQHAVTFAAGLAIGGYKPVLAVYSTFLQRAYDQVMEDVCLQNLSVVFAIDRAGIVGADGETHQGIFDLSYLTTIPGLQVLAPKNKWELSDMMKYAVAAGRPVAVRYPRGEAYDGLAEFRAPVVYGKAETLFEESGIFLLAVGSMVRTAEKVRASLKAKGLSCSLCNARFVKPFDTEVLQKAAESHRLIVTMEENVKTGGFGEQVAAYLKERSDHAPAVKIIALPDRFLPHGSPDELKLDTLLDAESITKAVTDAWETLPGSGGAPRA
ncbi:MAG: 1-deoxy-D-xylulose-5-phosphate synthase [Lachnospiraceae bacterium]|nr:1-deoxy-D-xylulose-5-phosphate synthase [Lachnospiraceae bacterium]